jgi:hypothetical protein
MNYGSQQQLLGDCDMPSCGENSTPNHKTVTDYHQILMIKAFIGDGVSSGNLSNSDDNIRVVCDVSHKVIRNPL